MPPESATKTHEQGGYRDQSVLVHRCVRSFVGYWMNVALERAEVPT